MQRVFNKRIWVVCFLSCTFFVLQAQQKSKDPLPTRQQLAWHEMEYYWFIHFGPNTFTDKEWGHGDEQADIFNPSQLDCRQWARIAKQSGAKGIIITAKHHDGFCLWPSKYSKHTVKESKWKDGKGDVVKDLMQACKEYGLKFGVYLSPWDRNHPQYGTPGYNDVYVNTMKELIDRYGPFFEFWWDGANGEGPNGKKQQYDFPRFEQTMRKYAPNTVVFSDIGPDIRWVGNEKGIAGQTNWNYLDTAGFKRGEGAPPTDTLNQGNINGKNWIPAECDVSILATGSISELHTNGAIFPQVNFTDGKNETFEKLGQYKNALLWIKFEQVKKINCIVLQEAIEMGQQVKEARLELLNGSQVVKQIDITTIGRKRILTFPAVEISAFNLVIKDAKDVPLISEIAAYLIDERLVEK